MGKSEPSLREHNMAKRRQRILHEARQLLTRGGYESLNLRALAQAAEVTVPTIYNLLGNKEALVVALGRLVSLASMSFDALRWAMCIPALQPTR